MTNRILSAFLCMAGGMASVQGYGDRNTYNYAVHPGFTVSPVNLGRNYSNMGIDWLSDGTLVMANCQSSGNYGGGSVPSPNAESGVYLVRNITGTPSVTQIASNFRQPSGVTVVRDVIYVADREAFYRINSNSGSGSANRTKVIDFPGPGTEARDYDNRYNNGFWHQYVYAPVYYNGRFYAPYSGSIGGGPSTQGPSSMYSGAYLSWAENGQGGLERFAGGLRSPNGNGLGPNGMFLFSDNQGSWMPSCPLNLARRNRFYGHKQNSGYTPNWAQALNEAGSMPYDPPVAWMLDGDAGGGGGPGQATSQPYYMDHGPYAGDWIVGDNNAKGISRVRLDLVSGSGAAGSYNGAVTYFTNGFGGQGQEAGVNRISMHPTQDIVYVGTMGFQGNWPVATAQPFFQIRFDAAAVRASFEILGARSRANGVEIEFSNPINPSTATASAFQLNHFQLTRSSGYGAGNATIAAPGISQVRVSNDGRRVFLQVGNIAGTDRILKITAGGIRSASGGTLWFNQVYFTHNYQSTQPFDPATTRVEAAPDRYLENRISVRPSGGSLLVDVKLSGAYTVSLARPDGKVVATRSGNMPALHAFPAANRGLHVLKVNQGGRGYTRPVFL